MKPVPGRQGDPGVPAKAPICERREILKGLLNDQNAAVFRLGFNLHYCIHFITAAPTGTGTR
jgi:hypothetical protein